MYQCADTAEEISPRELLGNLAGHRRMVWIEVFNFFFFSLTRSYTA